MLNTTPYKFVSLIPFPQLARRRPSFSGSPLGRPVGVEESGSWHQAGRYVLAMLDLEGLLGEVHGIRAVAVHTGAVAGHVPAFWRTYLLFAAGTVVTHLMALWNSHSDWFGQSKRP